MINYTQLLGKYPVSILKEHDSGTKYLTLEERKYFLRMGIIYDNLQNISSPSAETLFNSVGFPLTQLGIKVISNL